MGPSESASDLPIVARQRTKEGNPEEWDCDQDALGEAVPARKRLPA